MDIWAESRERHTCNAHILDGTKVEWVSARCSRHQQPTAIYDKSNNIIPIVYAVFDCSVGYRRKVQAHYTSTRKDECNTFAGVYDEPGRQSCVWPNRGDWKVAMVWHRIHSRHVLAPSIITLIAWIICSSRTYDTIRLALLSSILRYCGLLDGIVS